MKTEEELNALKEEIETLNKKLAELNEEELTQVCGGDANIDYTAGGLRFTRQGSAYMYHKY